MPQLLLLLGVLLILYVCVQYFKSADPKKIKNLMRYGLALAMGILALVILLKGNIPVALVLATGAVLAWQGSLWDVLAARAGLGRRRNQPAPTDSSMTREEALDILGLSGNPTVTEIKESHHKLMRKIHPDQGGSDYLAMKLNQAKDKLLEDHH